jgi:hypothetical protein
VRTIHFRALAVSLFAFFILPYLLFMFARAFFEMVLGGNAEPALLQAAVLLIWAWFLGPLGAGYLVAKLARAQPLWHGLLVGSLAAGFQALFFSSELWWVWGALVVVAVSSALFGAWLWRYRQTGNA